MFKNNLPSVVTVYNHAVPNGNRFVHFTRRKNVFFDMLANIVPIPHSHILYRCAKHIVCLDANAKDCRQRITRDSLRWQTICDGRMWQSPLIAKLGLSDVPGNLVIDDKGIIIDSNLKPEKLEEKINQLLK